MQVIVQVKVIATKEVVKEIVCQSERKAEKVEGGLLINLNFDEYYVDRKEV